MPSLNTRNLVPGFPEKVMVKRLPSTHCDTLETLLGTVDRVAVKALGISLRLSKKGDIEAIALANTALVVHITVAKAHDPATSASDHEHSALSAVLNHSSRLVGGVHIARILLLLHRQVDIRAQGVDLPILFPSIIDKKPGAPGCISRRRLVSAARQYAINALWYSQSNDNLCLRAWISACITATVSGTPPKAATACTRNVPRPHLNCLSLHVMNLELLEAAKPTHLDNDFERSETDTKGELIVHNARFKTRIRHSKQTFVKINGGEIHARVAGAKGKQTTLKLDGKLQGDICKLRVVGREEATCAESARDHFIMQVLQRKLTLNRSSYVKLLWFPTGKLSQSVPQVQYEFPSLNRAQRKVANAMISDLDPLVIAHGPPGTGKTTTIATALMHWQRVVKPEPTVWVIAQSNVGVKNIARSIVERGVDFKLLVSFDFHFEWHEHLYKGAVEDRLIRSEKWGDKDFDLKRCIGNARVILCTLAMLSSSALQLHGMFEFRPVEILVVDEASQIDTLEYMHLFDKFKGLRKVCMFGDPHQLPPYGKEQAPKMKTIFDFAHLKDAAYFLDTQYRMPVQLGKFISEAMYRSRLKSIHDTRGTSCIRAINVRKGEEEAAGSSWKVSLHTLRLP
ncbi:P-loop containing nucleoside triphosphate hydrolase protein [Lenzites betulinus]|nr:P-loop containing nucleoside triphosphate hydrolase protein [Lenzites betulinus]